MRQILVYLIVVRVLIHFRVHRRDCLLRARTLLRRGKILTPRLLMALDEFLSDRPLKRRKGCLYHLLRILVAPLDRSTLLSQHWLHHQCLSMARSLLIDEALPHDTSLRDL